VAFGSLRSSLDGTQTDTAGSLQVGSVAVHCGLNVADTRFNGVIAIIAMRVSMCAEMIMAGMVLCIKRRLFVSNAFSNFSIACKLTFKCCCSFDTFFCKIDFR
jgi:hypothetical protein